ncbi:hypothetical protein SAZ11_08500 [Streptomyces sp. FXJ1.4098]|nr:hypothetical protein [Streptomyces sp. FXJ1.4098]
MSNPNSTASAIGRLANDPMVFENKDGSKKVMFTAFVDRGYTDRQGNRISDALPSRPSSVPRPRAPALRARTQGQPGGPQLRAADEPLHQER